MNVTEENPRISSFLRYFTLIEALVLVGAGFGLFLFPETTRPIWPWIIAPFNAGFLGAIYLGAMVSIIYMFLKPNWSPTRPILRAIFTFTFIVLLVSLLTVDEFDSNNSAAIFGWFILYVSLPFSAGYHLFLYRSLPTSHLHSVSKRLGAILKLISLLLAIYGIGLLVLPEIFSRSFPWKIDVFHSQLYSSTFITGSIMLFTVSNLATPAEFVATGLTQTTFGLFSILGLVIVDSQVKKVDWSALNTIGWFIMLASFAVLGIFLIIKGSKGYPNET